MSQRALPAGWTTAQLGELIEFKYGKALPDKVRSGCGFPVFGSNGIVGMHSDALTSGPTLIVGRKGSVGVVHYSATSCSPIDTTYFVDQVPIAQFRYWYYQLKSLNLSTLNKSTAIPGLSRGDVYPLEIRLPPSPEQQRIADKLDTVLARVDAVSARLARVAPLLKRFRQSVLAAATSGALSDDWRKSSLLEKYSGSHPWIKCSLRQCVQRMTGGASPSSEDYTPTGLLVLNKGDIKPFGCVLTKAPPNRIPCRFAESHLTKIVSAGALLVTLRDLSSKADFLGLMGIYKGHESALLTQGMYSLQVTDVVLPEYLVCFSNSPAYREFVKQEKVGATQVHLRNDQLLDMPIALPTVPEQTEIVRRVELLFAFADRLEARLQAAQTATSRLTPSLLAKAFRGELVPQDPNDEPAAELLRRLAQTKPESTARGRKPRAKPNT